MKPNPLKVALIAGLVSFATTGCNLLDNGASGIPWIEATVNFTESRTIGPQLSVIDPNGSAALCAVKETVSNPYVFNKSDIYSCEMLDLGSKSVTMVLPATNLRFIKATYPKAYTKDQVLNAGISASSLGISAVTAIQTGASEITVNIDGDELAFNKTGESTAKGYFKLDLYTDSPVDPNKYNWDFSGNIDENYGAFWDLLNNPTNNLRRHTTSADGKTISSVKQFTTAHPFASKSHWANVMFSNGTKSSQGASVSSYHPVPITAATVAITDPSTDQAITARPLYTTNAKTDTVKWVELSTTWDASGYPTVTEIVTDGKTQYSKYVMVGGPDGGDRATLPMLDISAYIIKSETLYENTTLTATSPTWTHRYTREFSNTLKTTASPLSYESTNTQTCKNEAGSLAIYQGTSPTNLYHNIGQASYTCGFQVLYPIYDAASTTTGNCTTNHQGLATTWTGSKCYYYPLYPKYVTTDKPTSNPLDREQSDLFYDTANTLQYNKVETRTFWDDKWNTMKALKRRTYGADGKLIYTWAQGGAHQDNTFDKFGNNTSFKNYNADNNTLTEWFTETATYNTSGRITKRTQTVPNNAYSWESTFTFDDKGRYAAVATYYTTNGVKGTTPTCTWSNNGAGYGNATWTYATDTSGQRTFTTSYHCSSSTSNYSTSPVKAITVTLNTDGQMVSQKTANLSNGVETSATTLNYTYSGYKEISSNSVYTQTGGTAGAYSTYHKTYDSNNFHTSSYYDNSSDPIKRTTQSGYDSTGTYLNLLFTTEYTYK